MAKSSTSFGPGNKGNPKGRPAVDPEAKEILRAATPRAARRLIELIESADENVALKAASKVIDKFIGDLSEAKHEVEVIDAVYQLSDDAFERLSQAVLEEDTQPQH